MPNKQKDSTTQSFFEYLTSLGVSEQSCKNYRSDLNHFTAWIILKVKSFGSYIDSLTQAIPFLGPDIAKEYKSYLDENNIPVKTINRRLSTLRHFARFLVSTHVSEVNFMEGIENLSHFKAEEKDSFAGVVSDFRSYLESEKVSANTIKNYLSDINQFLLWLEQEDSGFKIHEL